MRIMLFEDHSSEELAPLTLLRPVFELVCGRESLRKRLQRWFPTAEFAAAVRPWLAESYAVDHPEITVNRLRGLNRGTTLLVNGRWMPERRLTPLDFLSHQAGFVDGVPAWMLCEADQIATFLQDDQLSTGSLTQFAHTLRIIPTHGMLLRHPWDLVAQNGIQLARDFADEGISQQSTGSHVQILGPASEVYISATAELDPYVVIDARTGPVSIDRDARIQAFTRIEGPCHIGRESQVFRALIRGGTTIGEHCRVGGEIENSILHAFVNKYHEGFLGHSYVCPWVNLGAMTSTSDLKNDYSVVQVPVNGSLVDSGISKVGSFIGDHTKTSLDCMFNTGSSIGIMSMVLSGGRLLPRHIPSFSQVMWGELATDWTPDSAIETARTVMCRRGQQLTPAAERLLRIAYQRTEPERQLAAKRAAARRSEQAIVR